MKSQIQHNTELELKSLQFIYTFSHLTLSSVMSVSDLFWAFSGCLGGGGVWGGVSSWQADTFIIK